MIKPSLPTAINRFKNSLCFYGKTLAARLAIWGIHHRLLGETPSMNYEFCQLQIQGWENPPLKDTAAAASTSGRIELEAC
jgi:hypothetical protein